MTRKKVAILGATGSIGTNTLEIIRQHPDHFELVAFSFYQNKAAAERIIHEFKPKYVAVNHEHIPRFESQDDFCLLTGIEGLQTIASLDEVDIVIIAIMGSIAIYPTLAAIQAKKHIGLANKETLVMAGEFIMDAIRTYDALVIPIDSEHSAIYQCLQGRYRDEVKKLWLTASGGALRDFPREALKDVTLAQVLKHPNWSMGAKITVDSATMMNKGLEVIEARWLFDRDYDSIDVLLHKESIVHSFIECVDGTYLAQLGPHDMKQPIQYAMTYPMRLSNKETSSFQLWEHSLHFEPVSTTRFPLLQMAYDVGKKGGGWPTVFNAANEVLVAAFLNQKIQFLSIEAYLSWVLEHIDIPKTYDLETLFYIDQYTREFTKEQLRRGLFD